MEDNQSFKIPVLITSLISIAMLLLGCFFDDPHAYYTLLRVVVFASAAFLAFVAYHSKKHTCLFAMGIIAVLFNPIIPFHLGKVLWQITDVLTAGVIFVGMIKLNRKKRHNAT